MVFGPKSSDSLRFNITQKKPYIVWSLGPKDLKTHTSKSLKALPSMVLGPKRLKSIRR